MKFYCHCVNISSTDGSLKGEIIFRQRKKFDCSSSMRTCTIHPTTIKHVELRARSKVPEKSNRSPLRGLQNTEIFLTACLRICSSGFVVFQLHGVL